MIISSSQASRSAGVALSAKVSWWTRWASHPAPQSSDRVSRSASSAISTLLATKDDLQGFDVRQVLRPTGKPLQADQVRNGGDANRGVAEVDDVRAGPQLVEVDQVLHEEVDLAHGVCGVPHREHPHPLLVDPLVTGGGVCEGERLHRSPRSQTHT